MSLLEINYSKIDFQHRKVEKKTTTKILILNNLFNKAYSILSILR